MEIVGTATMPTIGIQIGAPHPTMGTGALVSSTLIPASVSNHNDVAPPGPDAVLVRLRAGADPAASLRSLQRIAHELTLPMNYGVTCSPCSARPRSSTTGPWGRSRPSSAPASAPGRWSPSASRWWRRSAAAATTWRC